MASRNTMVWTGLEEFKAALAQLPEACLGEAEKAIESEANAAYVTIAAVYGAHIHTGTLRRLLTLSPLKRTGVVSGLQLRSGSPLAYIFDAGTEARHWKKNGKYTGRMPPTWIFSRTVGRARRNLTQRFKEMLLRQGAAKVTGE